MLDQDQETAAAMIGIGLGKLRRWEGGEVPAKLVDVHALALWAGVDRDRLASMLLDELAHERGGTAA
jgi:hypothetical protein